MTENKKVYFLRHGDTFRNVDNFNISIEEASRRISLSDFGKKQIEYIVSKIPSDIEYIIISDSLRTKQTADIIKSKYPNIKIIVDKDLRPWDSGSDNWQD